MARPVGLPRHFPFARVVGELRGASNRPTRRTCDLGGSGDSSMSTGSRMRPATVRVTRRAILPVRALTGDLRSRFMRRGAHWANAGVPSCPQRERAGGMFRDKETVAGTTRFARIQIARLPHGPASVREPRASRGPRERPRFNPDRRVAISSVRLRPASYRPAPNSSAHGGSQRHRRLVRGIAISGARQRGAEALRLRLR